MNFLPLAMLLAGGAILTIGDVVMKKWILSGFVWIFVLGIFFYVIGEIIMAMSFRYENIAVASVLMVLFNVIFLLTISWFYFHETISIYQAIGLFLAIGAIVFLSLK